MGPRKSVKPMNLGGPGSLNPVTKALDLSLRVPFGPHRVSRFRGGGGGIRVARVSGLGQLGVVRIVACYEGSAAIQVWESLKPQT